MIQADVLGRFPLPSVRVIIGGVPRGTPWSLSGSADDDEWFVASGMGDGFEVVTADPWAPLGVAATYTLRYGATAEQAGPVTRIYREASAVTDLTGRHVVNLRRMRAGGDPREGDRRAHFSQVSGSRFMPARLDPVAGAGVGGLTAQTTMPDTGRLRSMLATNRPMVLLHNRDLCEVPGCDTPAAQTIYVTSDGNDRSARTDAAHRLWSLSYRLMPSGVRGGTVPVVTLGDLKAAFPTLADLKASGMTLGQIKRGDWTVSGLTRTGIGLWVRSAGGDLTRTGEGEWVDGPVGKLVPSGEPGLFVIEGAS